MMKSVPYISIGAATFAPFAALLAWLALHGFVSAETIELVGKSIAARDGAMTLREMSLLFPPAPNLVSVALQWMLPTSTMPAPSIVSAFAVAILAMLWIRSFVQAGYSWATSVVMAAMLLCGPAFLLLACEGPSAALLTLGSWLTASAAFRLRARASIVDLIGFSVCLAYLAMSHSFAMLIAIGFAPFLILIVPPQVTSESVFGAYLTILFPLLMVVGGAAYVSWIFTTDPLGLFRALAARSGDVGFDGLRGSPLSYVRSGSAVAWPTYLLITALNAPVLLGGLAIARRRLPRAMPMVALLCAVPLAGIIGDLMGFYFSPLMMVAPLTGFVAATVAILPMEEQRPILVLLLAAAGAIGGAVTLQLAPNDDAQHWIDAMAGRTVEMLSMADRDVGASLVGRNDILVDATSAPGVVVGRRSANGLVVPLSASFELTRMSGRPTSRYIAVRNAEGFHRENDAVHAIFPKLYADGFPGYVRVYDHLGWRVYERAQFAGGG